jgi:hypothetical protein
MHDDADVRAQAAKRWMERGLLRVDEKPGGDAVLEQPAWADIYAAYKAAVPRELHWQPWRVAQELPTWVHVGRYMRKPNGDAKYQTVHYAGVRIKRA